MTTSATAIEPALMQSLERSDNSRRAQRAERIMWASPYEITDAVMGPVESMNLLREARECFVDGHFIATLMLGTALVEHVLAETLTESGLAHYGVGFENAIKLAQTNQLFPTELLNNAEQLRLLRNPYAHRKPDAHEHTLGNRYLSQKRHPRLVIEEDAKTALITMFGFFRHALKHDRLEGEAFGH